MAGVARRDDGRRVRILYLIDSLEAGGAERSLAAMAPHFRSRGVELEVGYLYERPGLSAELEAAGATLHPLVGGGALLGASVRAARLIRRRRPDLVHTTLFKADLVGRIATLGIRTPVTGSLVNTAYGPAQLNNPTVRAWKVRVAQGLDAISAHRVKRFHAVSASVADVMARRLRIPRDRIDVIPRGVIPTSSAGAPRRAGAPFGPRSE